MWEAIWIRIDFAHSKLSLKTVLLFRFPFVTDMKLKMKFSISTLTVRVKMVQDTSSNLLENNLHKLWWQVHLRVDDGRLPQHYHSHVHNVKCRQGPQCMCG
jgi:hypothetical protein